MQQKSIESALNKIEIVEQIQFILKKVTSWSTRPIENSKFSFRNAMF